MNKLGLCSITFRQLSCEEIIDLVKKAKLDAIEWGSDVHVVPNDYRRAYEIRKLMDENNLVTSSYGSYYRVGDKNEYDFEDIVEVAHILGAQEIRVWAGRRGSDLVDSEYFDKVVKDSIRIANLAAKKDIIVSYEYHSRTLTDNRDSAIELLETVNHDNIKIYWQPAVDASIEDRLLDIEKIKDYLTNVHVFSWIGIEREPLNNQIHNWKTYINKINEVSKNNLRYYLLEFVLDDSIENFIEDAKALRELF